jgi:hypothetical protein
MLINAAGLGIKSMSYLSLGSLVQDDSTIS